MTAVLEAPPHAPGGERRPRSRRSLAVVVVLAVAALALLGLSGYRAAQGSLSLGPVTPSFSGAAPAVTLPTYGLQGMHVLGYEHGATTRMSLPIRNRGLLPVTVEAVDLRGGIAPLLVVQDVRGLPLSLGPGESGVVEVTAELANCRFFHEREVQNYAGFTADVSLLGQTSTRWVAFDRPLMVRSPMIVGCPDRQLDRQANDRSDLTRAG